MNDRAAEAGAVLRLRDGQRDVRKRVSRVEPLIPEIAVEVAVQSVAAALASPC